MKKIKKLLTLTGIIVPVIVIAPTITSCGNEETDYPGSADGKDWKGYIGGDLTVELSGGYATITRNDGYVAFNLVIPNRIIFDGEEYPTEVIGENAFVLESSGQIVINEYMTGRISFPDTITEIRASAFQGCSHLIGTLNLPKYLSEIGANAFKNCLRFGGDLIIPKSVRHIGANAFDDCAGFTKSLTIPNSIEDIGTEAFANSTGFKYLIFNNFPSEPDWKAGSTNLFSGWKAIGIVTSNGSWSAADALAFAKTKSLPDSWK